MDRALCRGFSERSRFDADGGSNHQTELVILRLSSGSKTRPSLIINPAMTEAGVRDVRDNWCKERRDRGETRDRS